MQAVPGVKTVQGLGDGTFTLEADLDAEVRPELARCIVQRGWDLLELKTQEFTLEDVFMNLVTEEEEVAKLPPHPDPLPKEARG